MNLLRFSGTAPAEFDYVDKGHFFSEWQLKEAFPQLAESFGIDTFLHKFYNLPSPEYPLSALLYLDLKTKIPDSLLQIVETFSRRLATPYESPYLESSFVEKLAVFVESYQIIPDCLKESALESTSPVQNDLLLAHLTDLENGFLIQTALLSKKWLQTEVAHFKKTKEGGRPLWALLILEKWMTATGITFGA